MPNYSFTIVSINGLPAFERNGQAMNGHFRIADSADNAIAFCYLREHAELICSALNAGQKAVSEAEIQEALRFGKRFGE